MPFDLNELRGGYKGKRALVTGHTGFKGGWLTLWLSDLGAAVTGYALAPSTTPSLFEAAGVAQRCRHVVGTVQDLDALANVVREAKPDFVFHLAAQPLVRLSYEEPLETLKTNVLGTANLLEALRRAGYPCAVVVVTSDKCYENREWSHAYRENDPVGGHDPYSMSKGAAELVAASYRRSYFGPEHFRDHGVALATARAGNVIGGGDWTPGRIVPDIVGALAASKPVVVRNPASVRPWQHVLESLSGYLALGLRLASGEERWASAWNFGPRPDDAHTVKVVVEMAIRAWGSGTWVHEPALDGRHEAAQLRLAIDKAFAELGWAPRWSIATAIGKTVAWYKAHAERPSPTALGELCRQQIESFVETRSY